MKNTLLAYIDRFRHDRRERAMLGSVLLVLAIIVTLVVYWQLRLSGVAMTNATYCGYEEHVHTEECYEETLICGLEETEGHAHTDECYKEQQVIVCGLEESEEHTHDESCYELQLILACGLEESEGHVHTDECYEQTLICELEEHTHTVECLVDLTADVEDATIWEATLPELTGDLRTDVVNIAYSQLGYTESVANYTLGEDGVTHLGYTRYGAWYGNAYSDWDSMFVAFCLEYADITEEFTFNAGAYAWSVDLANLGYYQLAESYSPTAGDILFLDVDSDDKADNTAVVVAVDESLQTVTVIQGNYSVTDSEGDTIDTVALVTYTSPVILGYANLTPEEAVEEVAEEVTEEVTEEVAEEVTEEVAELTEEIAETDGEELTASAEEVVETEEGETEANETVDEPATVDYVSQVTALYTQAMSLAEGDTESAATVWDELMAIWEQIYAEEEAGTLALTTEEYDNIDALTDEVYDYFVNTVGYDPYAMATLEELGVSADKDFSDYVTTFKWDTNGDAYFNSSDDYIHVPLILEFEGLKASDILSHNGVFHIELPDGLTPSSDLIGAIIQSGSDSAIAFTFEFVQDGVDSEGNPIYYIEITFDTSGLDPNDTTSVYWGNLHFEAIYKDTNDKDEIEVYYDENYEVVVNGEDIKGDDNETYNADIYVSKSSSSYDVSSNTITYTIKVWSTKGTAGNDITLADLLSVSGSGLIDDDIVKIEINSVTSTEITVDQWGTKTYDQSTTTDANYSSSTTDDGFTLTLGAIDEVCLVEYTITYTVTFEPESTTVSATVANTATAKVEEKDIENEYTTSTRVSTSYVDKTGSYSNGYITWTITINPTGSDIVGLIYTDDYFADAIDLVVTNNTTGAEADGSEWSYTDSTKTAITFNATTSEGTNTNTYTITYKTEVEQNFGVNPSYENEVTVTNGSDEKLDSDSSKVTTNVTKGSLAKSFDGTDGTTTENGYTYVVLKWSSSINVPPDSDGIAAGTVIYDYLGTNDYDYYSYDQTSKTSQWYTYDQITALFNQLTSTISANVTTNFTLSAYDPAVGNWVTYDTLTTDSTYESHVFTAFKIVFNEDVNYTGTIDFSYSTTANVTGVETEKNYWNILFTDNLKATAKYTYYNSFYKTDGNDKTDDTSITLSEDGILTWRVRVYVTGDVGTIKVVDSLPTVDPYSVDFSSATVSFENVNNVIATIDSSGVSSSSDISASVSANGRDMTIEIPSSLYTTLDLPGYIIITYTCKVDFDPQNDTLGKVEYENSATLYYDDEEKATDKQKQIVTYPEEQQEEKKVIKGVTYNTPNGILDYYVVVNIGKKDIDETSDYLDFVDTMTTVYSENWKSGLIVSLKSGSVKFYQLIELIYQNGEYYYDTGTVDSGGDSVYAKLTDLVGTYSSSDLYYTDGGTAYYKLLLDTAWTYSEEVTAKTDDYTTTAHVISATIPDETAIYVEYSYYIDTSFVGKGWNSGDIENTASVYKESSDSVTPSGTYAEPTAGGTAGTSGSLTLIKVDGNNFSSTLSGATFEIYYYDTTTSEFVSTEKKVTSNANGTLSVTMSAYELNYNTLYYLVETEAPTGYLCDTTTRYYFYWYDKDVTTITLPSDMDTITSGSLVVPLSEYSYTAYAANYSSSENTLMVRKTVYDGAVTDERLSGATYTLYEYDADSQEWVVVETRTTSTRGNIEISMSDGLTYNTAYKLVETVYPDGYEPVSEEDSADHDDQTEVYFWWSSTNTTLFPLSVPDSTTWSTATTDIDGSTEAKAIDLSSGSTTQIVTNTKIPTTSVTVNKSWVDDSGDPAAPESGAYVNAQLYYYLGEAQEVDTGESTTNTAEVYIGGSAIGESYSSGSQISSSTSTGAYTSVYVPLGQQITATFKVSYFWGTNTSAIGVYKYEGSDSVDNGSGGTYSYYKSVNIAEIKLTDTSSVTENYTTTYTYTFSGEFTITDTSPLLYMINDTYTSGFDKSIVLSYPDPDDSSITWTNTYDPDTYKDDDHWSGWSSDGSGTGGSTGEGNTGATYTYNELTGVVNGAGQEYLDEEGCGVVVTLTSDNNWTYDIDDLPKYVYSTDANGKLVKQYYYYYFVEVGANGAVTSNATYSQADGVTGTTSTSDDNPDENDDEGRVITITNTVTKTDSVLLPSTGGTGTTLLYEFGGMLILLALVGAGGYRNLSRLRKSLVSEPTQEKVSCGEHRKRVPGMRNRKFVTHRHPRKGDTRAGPDG